MKKKYSQQEIAAALNVSRGTIDRVLHNRGGIGAETTRRVKEYLEQLEYTPNKVGQGLSKKLNRKITFIYHVPENEFFAEIQRGIDTAVHEYGDFGFSVQAKFTNRSTEEQIRLIEQEVENGADAIAVSAFEPDKLVDAINRAVRRGVPVVTFNNDVPASDRLFYVGTDYYQSGRVAGELMNKIVKRGKIAVLLGLGNDWQVSIRLQGFKDVLSHNPHIQIVEKHIGTLPRTETSYQAAVEAIQEGADAIFPLQAGVRGIVQAKRELEASHVDMLIYDLRSLTKAHLQDGSITAVIGQSPFYQGYYPVKLLFGYFFEGTIPSQKVYFTRLDIVMKENIAEDW